VFRDLFRKEDQSPSRPAPTAGQTILAIGAEFEGRLRTQGHVRLDDIFIGDIIARGQVVINAHATLDGSLVCAAAVVRGLVRGGITAETVTVAGTGRVLGDIHAVKLITEGEAILHGKITLVDDLDLSIVREETGSKT
jgi:cytoskeletal protein CcmA (bactofilin family)